MKLISITYVLIRHISFFCCISPTHLSGEPLFCGIVMTNNNFTPLIHGNIHICMLYYKSLSNWMYIPNMPLKQRIHNYKCNLCISHYSCLRMLIYTAHSTILHMCYHNLRDMRMNNYYHMHQSTLRNINYHKN